jgi:hypothetical protein
VRTNSNATPPTAEFHLAFLAKIERLLSQGRFTSTYKFALLIALTNIAVEQGDDSGDELEVEVDEIARRLSNAIRSGSKSHATRRRTCALRQSHNGLIKDRPRKTRATLVGDWSVHHFAT